MRPIIKAATILAFLAVAAPAEAQLFYFGIRGGAGIPTGEFADTTQGTTQEKFLHGAKSGFGYGLDAGINMGPLGIYAGFDHINFDCEPQQCSADTKYKLQGVSAGVRLSIPLFPLVKPWVKAGVTLNELEADFSGSSSAPALSTERTPGYELGAGIDIPIAGGFLSLTPQARYVGQKLDYKIPGVSTGNTSNKAANYYTFDLGLRLRSPI
jgi:opacity protein-like surface antigen